VFGISFFEIIIVLIVALLVFGPERLPEVARSLGKLTGQLRRSTDLVRREFHNAIYTPAQEISKELEDASRSLRTMSSALMNEPKHPLCPDTPPESPAAGSAESPPAHDCPDCAAKDKSQNPTEETPK
jgi:Tat protein translocase TatB subunit